MGETTSFRDMSRTERKIHDFHEFLWIQYGRGERAIANRELRERIAHEFGSDLRTIRKYVKILKDSERLETIRGQGLSEVYRVTNPQHRYITNTKEYVRKVKEYLKEDGIDVYKTISEIEAEKKEKGTDL